MCMRIMCISNMYVCMYVCLSVCLSVCMYVCLSVCICICVTSSAAPSRCFHAGRSQRLLAVVMALAKERLEEQGTVSCTQRGERVHQHSTEKLGMLRPRCPRSPRGRNFLVHTHNMPWPHHRPGSSSWQGTFVQRRRSRHPPEQSSAGTSRA